MKNEPKAVGATPGQAVVSDGLKSSKSRLNRSHMLVIGVVFALLGTITLLKSSAATPTVKYVCPNPKPTLGIGATGDCVKRLQWDLNLSNQNLVESGTFDTATQNAVINFQRFFQMPATGVVDGGTWYLLDLAMASNLQKQGLAVIEPSATTTGLAPAPAGSTAGSAGNTAPVGGTTNTTSTAKDANKTTTSTTNTGWSGGGTATSTPQATVKYVCPNPKPTLGIGATGDCVKRLQWDLNLSNQNLTESGTFDTQTQQAVANFQNFFQMPMTGVVDGGTWYMLDLTMADHLKQQGLAVIEPSATTTGLAPAPAGSVAKSLGNTQAATDLHPSADGQTPGQDLTWLAGALYAQALDQFYAGAVLAQKLGQQNPTSTGGSGCDAACTGGIYAQKQYQQGVQDGCSAAAAYTSNLGLECYTSDQLGGMVAAQLINIAQGVAQFSYLDGSYSPVQGPVQINRSPCHVGPASCQFQQ